MRPTLPALCLALTLGCADNPAGGGTIALDAGRGGCVEGASTCAGQIHQVCRGGTFVDEAVCDGTCTPGLGCGACDPSRPAFCDGDDLYACAEGRRGDFLRTCDEGCTDGGCVGECAEGAELIYVVDNDNTLLSFDPRANFFQRIGTLRCPAGPPWPEFGGGFTATPFSMAVERTGRAFVLYSSGEIFFVDIRDASCRPSEFRRGSGGFELFGMGFVSNGPGRAEETLFITGGPVGSFGDGTLATLDPVGLTPQPIGRLPPAEYGAELTGNGAGELWAYNPGQDSRIARIDKRTARAEETFDLPPLESEPAGWAFAHWGGRYFVFISTGDGLGGVASSRVLRFDPATGRTDVAVEDAGRRIVGAGVSTCAPTMSNF